MGRDSVSPDAWLSLWGTDSVSADTWLDLCGMTGKPVFGPGCAATGALKTSWPRGSESVTRDSWLVTGASWPVARASCPGSRVTADGARLVARDSPPQARRAAARPGCASGLGARRTDDRCPPFSVLSPLSSVQPLMAVSGIPSAGALSGVAPSPDTAQGTWPVTRDSSLVTRRSALGARATGAGRRATGDGLPLGASQTTGSQRQEGDPALFPPRGRTGEDGPGASGATACPGRSPGETRAGFPSVFLPDFAGSFAPARTGISANRCCPLAALGRVLPFADTPPSDGNRAHEFAKAFIPPLQPSISMRYPQQSMCQRRGRPLCTLKSRFCKHLRCGHNRTRIQAGPNCGGMFPGRGRNLRLQRPPS